MSSDSDAYGESETGSLSSDRRHVPRFRRGRVRHSASGEIAQRVDALTSSLQVTNHNLQGVDDLINQYRNASNQQTDAIKRLRGNLSQQHGDRSERFTRQESDTMSASELRPSRLSKPRPSVRFRGKVDKIHELHQDVHDLSREQSHLAEELAHERRQRSHLDADNRRLLLDLKDSVNRSQQNSSKPSERVEKRLQDLQEELRIQRDAVNNKFRHQLERDSIKAEIRETVLNASREEDRVLRSRLNQVEADRQKLASELDSTRRKLHQSKGSSSTLQQHVESLKGDLARSDGDRDRLRTELNQLRESFHDEDILTRRERQLNARQENDPVQKVDTVKMDQEIQSLRMQLSQANSYRDFEDQRKELENTHRQKQQLSEHINTLEGELDKRERQQGKLLMQLNKATDSLTQSEVQREVVLSQLEDLQGRLKEKARETQASVQRATNSEQLLAQSRQKTEARQKKLVDLVKQLKLRCKKLEREQDVERQAASQQQDRTEELTKENEALRAQRTTIMHKMENLQREISDVLERLARQAEDLRLRDVDINELKSSCLKMDQELREKRNLTDKLERDLHGEQVKLMSLSGERLQLIEQLDSTKASLHDAQAQNKRIQKEVHSLTTQNAELTSRLTEMSGQKKDLDRQLAVVGEEKNNVKQDLSRLDAKFREVQDYNASLTDKLYAEMQATKTNEAKIIQDLTQKQKREKAEQEAEIQALKLELQELRSLCKAHRRQLDRGKEETDRAREQMRQLDDENIKLRRNYDRMRAGLEEQAQLMQVGDNRSSVLEKQLERAEVTVQSLRQDHVEMMRSLSREVDTLVALIVDDTHQDFSQSFSTFLDSPHAMLSALKNKLYLVEKEVRRQCSERQRLRDNLNSSRAEVEEARQDHRDHTYTFASYMDKADHLIRDLHEDKQDLQLKNVERLHAVHSLEKQVENMEDHIREGAKVIDRSLGRLGEQEHSPPQPYSAVSEFTRLKELEAKRHQIEEKYNRYETTVAHLHQQLKDSRKLNSSPPRRDTNTSRTSAGKSL